MIGQRLSNFEVVERLGVGGMGEVYCARHVRLGHSVAIKVLRPEFSSRTDVVERFFIEAKAAASLKHPGIIQVHDFGTEGGVAFIVMEHLLGESLRSRLANGGPMDLGTVQGLVAALAEVLTLAHSKGIIHRDLKPDNVFLARETEGGANERVKVLDFGIAKLAEVSGGTETGAMLGTPQYISPEQTTNAAGVTASTDLYALACMTFELLTGRPPFNFKTLPELITAHLYSEPPTLLSCGVQVPHHVEDAIRKALAKSPDKRHANVDEFERHLRGKPPDGGAVTNVAPDVAKMLAATQVPAELSANVAPSTMLAETRSDLDPRTKEQSPGPPRSSRAKLPLVLAAAVAAATLVVVLVLSSGSSSNVTVAEARISEALQPTKQRCDGGDAGACRILARAFNGVDLADDSSARLQYAKRACGGGDGDGCLMEGLANERGEGTAKDPTTALSLFLRSCDLGDGGGCNAAGLHLYSGQFGTKDPVRALEHFKRGCALRSFAACGNSATLHFERGDRDVAIANLDTACTGGVVTACLDLATVVEGDPKASSDDREKASKARKNACKLDKRRCL